MRRFLGMLGSFATACLAASACGDGSSDSNGAGGDGGATSDASSSSDGSASTDGAIGDDAGGDEQGPWAGGAAYYAKWTNGPSSDPTFFPISVWLQSPNRASDYAAIGVNQYIGLYNTPTDADFASLTTANVRVGFDQSSVGLAHATNKIIFGWTQQDEPDNAQPVDGGYGPCISASAVQSLYTTMVGKDATRPVFLNLGQGVANDAWPGRGSCTGTSDYPDYEKGADIVSFDVYPVNDSLDLTLPAKGVDRLGQWASYKKPVWNWIECTAISDPAHKPTPAQVKAEVWMSIVHGSMGIGYFVHQLAPTFDEHALLDDPTMKAAVTAINAQITALAPVLNTPPLVNVATSSSSDASVPVDVLVKRSGGATYLFVVAIKNAPTKASFTVNKLPATAMAEVLGESRSIAVTGGAFSDDFVGWGVHIYKVH